VEQCETRSLALVQYGVRRDVVTDGSSYYTDDCIVYGTSRPLSLVSGRNSSWGGSISWVLADTSDYGEACEPPRTARPRKGEP